MTGTGPTADLVLEGGGVKGIAHVGALTVLEGAGYSFHRVAGASAGAIVAAFVAAGLPADRMRPLMAGGPNAIDYSKVPQPTVLDRLPVLGKPLELLLEKGIYSGDYLRDWVGETLRREAGAETFGDLRLADPERRDLGPDQAYRLVVMVADISRGQLVRLPWDYRQYGLDPDHQRIADAVRASASIPFFFQPVRLPWAGGSRNVSYLVDGGTVSDFPIEVFDRADDRPPRWPTFGVKLEPRPAPGVLANTVDGTLSFAGALLETIINGSDQVHLADPCVATRTMFVDTLGVLAEDFGIDPQTRDRLFASGERTARDFLAGWSWERWLHTCGAGPDRAVKAVAARGERPRP